MYMHALWFLLLSILVISSADNPGPLENLVVGILGSIAIVYYTVASFFVGD